MKAFFFSFFPSFEFWFFILTEPVQESPGLLHFFLLSHMHNYKDGGVNKMSVKCLRTEDNRENWGLRDWPNLLIILCFTTLISYYYRIMTNNQQCSTILNTQQTTKVYGQCSWSVVSLRSPPCISYEIVFLF